MVYRICKTFEIESGHMLSRHPDKCRFPHGHSRRVEFVLEADDLDASGMVCDFKALGEVMRDFLDGFDHALCVNTADPHYPMLKAAFGERVVGFEDAEPTTEVMARRIYDEVNTRLAARAAETGARRPVRNALRVVRVRVWETSSSWAEYGV